MLALTFAAADLAVATWLLLGARTARRPEPARVTSLLLLICVAVLVIAHLDQNPPPTVPPPAPTSPTPSTPAPLDVADL